MKKIKRLRDTNQLAKSIVDLATGQAVDPVFQENENQRLGGLKGGKARAKKLSKAQRVKIAKKAAKARWKKK